MDKEDMKIIEAVPGRIEICDNCVFWLPPEDIAPNMDEEGECRRFPPVRKNSNGHGEWPETYPDEWCGEFRQRLNAG